jgi:hypothetical protein
MTKGGDGVETQGVQQCVPVIAAIVSSRQRAKMMTDYQYEGCHLDRSIVEDEGVGGRISWPEQSFCVSRRQVVNDDFAPN